eukprot:4746502-Prymnesium_polylepis.2
MHEATEANAPTTSEQVFESCSPAVRLRLSAAAASLSDARSRRSEILIEIGIEPCARRIRCSLREAWGAQLRVRCEAEATVSTCPTRVSNSERGPRSRADARDATGRRAPSPLPDRRAIVRARSGGAVAT